MTTVDCNNRRHFLVLTGTGMVALLVGCSAKDDGVNGGTQSADGFGGAGWDGTDDGGTGSGGTEVEGSESSGTESGSLDSGDSDAGESTDTGDTADPVDGGSGTSDGGSSTDDCTSTESDIEGPFYISGAPVRSNLDLYGDAGTVLLLSGVVQDLECKPLSGAVVEIWHADPTSVPVDELTAADSVDYDNTSPEMRYRGQVATDVDGRYTFRTKKPGWYLNGPRFRPMHFHMKIWVGGVERLTTQLYFEGDPYIDGDSWASLDRAMAVIPEGEGVESARFDFTVAT